VALVELFHPSAIIVRKDYRATSRTGRSVEPILKSIRREARLRSIPLYIMKSIEISRELRLFRAGTKYEMAVALTGMFPELIWSFPTSEEPGTRAACNGCLWSDCCRFAYAERNQKRYLHQSDAFSDWAQVNLSAGLSPVAHGPQGPPTIKHRRGRRKDSERNLSEDS